MSYSTTSTRSLDSRRRLESRSRYVPGGYHPLEIGDEVHDGRYLVLHRLGHGGYSTVWLALDQSYDNSTPPDPLRPRYVALKIVSASRGQQEATLLYELQARFQSQLARGSLPGGHKSESRHIITLLDYFQISGPNGSHCCLVTEILGPSVADIHRYPEIEGEDLLPLPVARSAAMQCTEALVFLHSQGIAHAGIFKFLCRSGLILIEQLTGCILDLHLRNIAFEITADINSWTVEELYAALGGEPVKIPFHEAPDYDCYNAPPLENASFHQPKYLVATPTVPHLWALCIASEPRIRLIDFSESFRLPFHPESQTLPGTPWEFAAPELLLNLPAEVTLSIDIWALGCIIYSLLGHCSPFIEPFGNLQHILAEIMIYTGGKDRMPESFRRAFSKFPALKSSEEQIGMLFHIIPNWDCHLRGQLDNPDADDYTPVAPLGTEDYEVVRAVIAASLVVDPAKRAPARKILEILREAWGMVMDPPVLDLDHLGLVHDTENKMHKHKIISTNQCGFVSGLVPVSH